ncbi:hypothetical protein ACFXKD_30505 [Nocardiopsis aegyptia]|uniref:hypothetical protein n=1 Tax=Nocardiopsis aegyptia TaxID=220378 RepID=UPI00366DA145
MRSVFVFPSRGRTRTAAVLDRHLAGGRGYWGMDGIDVDVDDVRTGHLFSDWDPAEVAVVEAALGHRPDWAVVVGVSGRIDGTAQVRRLAALLLDSGGVAVDDHSDHPWTPREIGSDAVVDGLRFFRGPSAASAQAR